MPYDKRADIYSLGMVLYYLSNDRHLPFSDIIDADERMPGSCGEVQLPVFKQNYRIKPDLQPHNRLHRWQVILFLRGHSHRQHVQMVQSHAVHQRDDCSDAYR